MEREKTKAVRAAVYYSNSDIRVEERPRPEIGDGEILVKVEASGICGTDCLEWYRKDKVPLVLGHEIAGTIVSVGKGIKRYRPGDRVSASHHVPCGECRLCRAGHETVCDTLRKTSFDPGGFAEFVRIPKINVDKFGIYSIPKNVSFEEATFVEPLACVVRGQRLAGFKKEKSILVIGSGISGLLHIRLARTSGAKNIVATDINDFRLDAAKRSGADFVFNSKDYTPEKLRAVNGGYLADLVVICSGAKPAFEQGLRSVERGGTVLIFAAADKDALLPVSTNDMFWRSEVTVLSSYAGSPADHIEALGKIDTKRVIVHDMITHRVGLFDAVKGFRLVAGAGESLKVIVEPQR